MSTSSCKLSVSKAQKGKSSTTSELRKRKRMVSPSAVWLVFVTEERGGNGYCGYDYDNGSHSATLEGVYASKSEAERHAATLREDTDEESDDEDYEVRCERRSVKLVRAPVQSKFEDQEGNIWNFEADTDLVAPRYHGC